MRYELFLICAYFLGAVPTAYLAGRLKGVDIRKHGSGNVGATNAFRVLGKGPGLAVFVLDFLKGAAPVWVFQSTAQGSLADSTTLLFIGLAALLGHVFTPFLGFKGGKGIATGAGVLAAGFPPLFAISLAVWGLLFVLSKTVSISSLGSVLALSVSSVVLGYNSKTVSVFLVLTAFIFWTHRSNITRLMKGEEKPNINRQNR